MTIAIQTYLAQKFPGKKIGPLDLKRSMTEARKLKENMADFALLSDQKFEP
jgi:glutathione S-transferase